MRSIRRSLANISRVVRGVAWPRRAALCLVYSFLIFAAASCTSEDRIDAPKIATLSTPPAAGGPKPVEAVAPIPTPMDTFRALAPPEGAKFTPLFAEPMRDADARFARLEAQVQSLRNDFDTVVPSLVRLVAVEKDMKNLVAQLQTLTDASGPAVPAVPPPSVAVPAPATTPPPSTPPPPKTPPPPIVETPPASPIGPAPVAPAKETPKPAIKKKTAKHAKAAPKETSGETPKEAPKEAPSETPAEAPNQTPPNDAPPAKSGANEVPAEKAVTASSPVSPEAAPKGNQSPEGAASLPFQALPMKTDSVMKAAPTPPSKPSAPVPPVAPHAVTPTGALAVVKAVRAGDHGDVTNLVIEMSAHTGYTATLAPGGKQLVISLPDASWTAGTSGALASSHLATSFKYEKGKLVVNLSAPAAIESKQLLKPEGAGGYRLVVSLIKAK